MTLTNSKDAAKNSGFTIVELLIVIVVIAILATISIVAYSGIQTRAKDTKATANATQVQKIAEAYYADNSAYPTTTTQFSNATTKLPSNLTIMTAATAGTLPTLSGSNGENNIMYRYVTGAAGACVYFWDYSSGASGALSTGTFMGTATSANCSGTTAANGNTPTS